MTDHTRDSVAECDERAVVNIEDYRNAPSGVGPLARTWGDKPHRLLYDLCSEVDLLDLALTAIVTADSLDQARGLAHAALHREEYHGHDGGGS